MESYRYVKREGMSDISGTMLLDEAILFRMLAQTSSSLAFGHANSAPSSHYSEGEGRRNEHEVHSGRMGQMERAFCGRKIAHDGQ